MEKQIQDIKDCLYLIQTDYNTSDKNLVHKKYLDKLEHLVNVLVSKTNLKY